MVIFQRIKKGYVLHITVGNADGDATDFGGGQEYVFHIIGMVIVVKDVETFNVIEEGLLNKENK